MTALNYTAVQTAIYNKLTANAGLISAVSGIFSHTPQGTAFPYINIGSVSTSELSSLGKNGIDYSIDIHSWSKAGGHKQTADILDLLYQTLHNSSITVSGCDFIAMRVSQTSITLENDGITYHGLLRLNVLLKEAA